MQIRVAPTLGALEDTPANIWGTTPYENPYEPAVFMGLYGLPDFYFLWRHKGPKYILWCGTDITHFKNGYWLDDDGLIRLDSKAIAAWINEYCDSWVENEVEYQALKKLGIESSICPSFLGDVNAFEISYTPSEKPKLYTSVSGNNFELYGWHKIPELAKQNPDIEFHCYGSTTNPWPAETWPDYTPLPNIFLHGRVSRETMNEEIAEMQGALRLTEFDGFSEILAKSVLMGQWPVSHIKYPHMLGVEEIKTLKYKREPNKAGREFYIKNVNKFPWVK